MAENAPVPGEKRTSAPPNQLIKFKDRIFTKHIAIANQFNIQYTNVRRHFSSKSARVIQRKIKDIHKLNNNFRPFTADDTAEAIKNSKNSTALGPDDLSTVHFKHMGPSAISFLTELYNLSVAQANLPAIWKRATVLPVLKPGKSADEGVSYRPISLLCPASKILEKLIHPYLKESFALDESQHSFWSRRPTTSALLPLVTTVADGFNKAKPPKRTVVAAIDLSKAFDSVNHDILLSKICDSPLNSNLVRWLSTYLRGREQAVIYNGKKTSFKKIHRGVPQGAVISPTLFNFYVSDFPTILSEKTSFADDFTIYASSVDIEEVEAQLTQDLDIVKNWASSLDLDIAPNKSSITLFSPSTHEHRYHPQVKISNSLIPLAQHPKILGVTFDPLFTFSPHARAVAKGSAERLKVIKALSGTSWGQDSETLLLSYKVLVRTKLDYAAPVWSANVKPSSTKRLQSIQNSAMRLVTGSHKMASENHLHSETKMLPVSDHISMLSGQYLASASRLDHPAHEPVSRPARRRDKKKTLQSKFKDDVAPHLVNDSLPYGTYPLVKKLIHTKYVSQAISAQGNHPLLNRPIPLVNKSEETLPRHYRSTLSQLRSGHCANLTNYLHRVGRSDSPSCPLCGNDDQTVPHLFNCTNSPTDLNLGDLWLRPRRVANFLSAHPSFTLPPLGPPPLPRPPPEPPP